jgi:hypothetical protein
MKLFFPFLLLFVSCVAMPDIKQFSSEAGTIYFIPPTNWKTASNDKARLDVTYHAGTGLPAVVNISFLGKKASPKRVASVILNGVSEEFPLTNIKALFVDAKKQELRITTNGDRDTLTSFLETEFITLIAEIDGVKYIYFPDKHFIELKNNFLILVSY